MVENDARSRFGFAVGREHRPGIAAGRRRQRIGGPVDKPDPVSRAGKDEGLPQPDHARRPQR